MIEFTPNLITKIKEIYGDDNYGIAKGITEVHRIFNHRNSIHRMQEELKNEYENKRRAIEVKIDELQSECHHISTTYHPDPCGDDSYTECDICGMAEPTFR